MADAAQAAAGVISCVADRHPRFYLEALRWYASATEIAGVAPLDLRVKLVGEQRTDVADYLRSRGVGVEEIEIFDGRSPHCNKISGALSLSHENVHGVGVLSDADLIVLEDPRSIVLPPTCVGMKPVDRENPPMEVLQAVFRAAGVPEPPPVDLPLQPGHQTLAGNGNGGLYVVPAGILPAVAQAWGRWARWLLDRPQLLGRWADHVDQVAMAVALAAEEIEVVSLDPRWNAPTHVDELIEHQEAAPAIIHYHQRVDEFAQVETVGVQAIDELIERANAATRAVWRSSFPNATFWNWRYTTCPAGGSGQSSRGKALRRKRRMLARVLQAVGPASVLDVGCGDGEVVRGFVLPRYTGLDVARQAISRASAGRPGGTYILGDLVSHPVEADLVVCLDVLTSQADAGYYGTLVDHLLRSAKAALLVSGYERAPSPGLESPIGFYHEPLSATLVRFGGDHTVQRLCEEDAVVTVLVVKSPGSKPMAGPTVHRGWPVLSVWTRLAGAWARRLRAGLPTVHGPSA